MGMVKKGKKRRVIWVVMVLLMLTQFTTALADTPYKTYTQDGIGEYVETQTAYEPVTSINKIGDYTFSKPTDFKISQSGLMYIVDSDNKRVIVSDLKGNFVRLIGEGDFASPQGIFVTKDETIYVADDKKGQIFVYSKTGELLNTYGKPNHPLFGAESTYKPQKIVVDDRGTMYIVSEGNTNGIIQLSPTNGGTFLGYFGANDTRIKFLTLFRKFIFAEEQESRMAKSEPVTIANLTIDEKGLVYTVSQGEKATTLKKMNIAGKNLIAPDVYDDYPGAVTIGHLENIFVASKNGYIYEYNKEGSLLFVFGARDDGKQRVGMFKTVSAVAVDPEGNLYVLDEEKNEVQVFRQTEFAELVHEALALYQNGRYIESKEPWQKVLRMNSLFDYANLGMGEAYFKEENYPAALKSYRLASYYDGYSNAFWEVRNVWMKKNLIPVLILLGLFYLITRVVGYIDRKRKILNPLRAVRSKFQKITLYNQLMHMFYTLKNPADGYYGIRREGKTSYKSANIILLFAFAIFLLNKYAVGYLYLWFLDDSIYLLTDMLSFFGLFLLLVICNYLVSTIKEGEGRFRDIYQGAAYAMTPYILVKPIVIILTHVLTYNEYFLIQFGNFIAVAWTLIMVFLMIKYINDYSFGDTIKIILYSLFCVLIAILVIFILYVLITQVTEFIQSFFGEVVYRLGSN